MAPMGLNIKNPRVYELAQQAAAVTGSTMTGVIEQALEQFLRQHGTDPDGARVSAKVDIVRGIVAEYGADPGVGEREIRTVEDLYDDSGLPR